MNRPEYGVTVPGVGVKLPSRMPCTRCHKSTPVLKLYGFLSATGLFADLWCADCCEEVLAGGVRQ